MERDPVCGMTVDPERAKARLELDGKTYFFCCEGCARKFRAEPAKFLNSKAAPSAPPHGHSSVALIQLGAPSPARMPVPAASASKPATSPARKTCIRLPDGSRSAQDHPGACPKCGMALEPDVPPAPATRIEYTCPMHPEIVRSEPGACPICGMALEPRTVAAAEEANPELVAMTRRFWISVALTVPVLLLGMSDMIPGQPLEEFLSMRAMGWIELVLATPVVLWGGWPFFAARLGIDREPQPEHVHADRDRHRHGLRLQRDRRPLPRDFPAILSRGTGEVPVYFEAAAAITTLVLLGQVLELRARSRTDRAIRALLELSPENGAPGSRRRHGNRRARRTRRSPATCCACAPARKFRSMAS